jgi:hypothetical protein
MLPASRSLPCSGYSVAVSFPDVEPEVLAREAAHEAGWAARPGAGAWQSYLGRVLPALERSVPGDMAHALLAAGTGAHASRAHAERMRRQALAAGAVGRARFWADVSEEVARVTRA